ncbi:MAG: HAD family phosphatase [Gammaproteobacteria bacterium]|nr:HAD family phosphatase [Gammaproteobacteria bacterium]
MRRARGVVFDMDGIILDTEPIYRRASQRAAAELGYLLSDELYARLIGRAAADVETTIHRELGAGFPLARFRHRWVAHWESIVAQDGIALKAGLLTLLEMLEDAGVPFAVATSTHAGRARASLAAAGVGTRFPVLVAGDEVARGKPAPDIFIASAARLGLVCADCLAIEDSEAGIVAAAAAGMRTVLIPDLAPASAAAVGAAAHVLGSLDAAVPVVCAWFATAQPRAGHGE